jgi:DNA-binding XRE family transcriptional regulator
MISRHVETLVRCTPRFSAPEEVATATLEVFRMALDSLHPEFHVCRVPNAFYRNVAKRIAEVRKARGLTQVEGALGANLNRSLLARIEAGEENLSLQTLSRLALAYGVQPAEFLRGLEADPASLVEVERKNRRTTA